MLAGSLMTMPGLLSAAPPSLAVASAEAKRASDQENAAIRRQWDLWNAPVKPFRLIGNIYYVGAVGVSSFLITTPGGHILIDTGFDKTVPRIQECVTKLGFRMNDIRFLLSSHAHLDHTGGHARMKELTGAKILISEADAILLGSGGTNDFTPYSAPMKAYRPALPNRIVMDGEQVTLGGTTLTCHLTPGHTKGCTTWTMDVQDGGETRHVLFFGSTSILPGVPLVNNTSYPAIAEDLARTYRTLEQLPCDVFLAPHAGFFGLAEKAQRLENGEQPNPFIDPRGWRSFLADARRTFQAHLEKEQNALRTK